MAGESVDSLRCLQTGKNLVKQCLMSSLVRNNWQLLVEGEIEYWNQICLVLKSSRGLIDIWNVRKKTMLVLSLT